jgi:hypothetical protein
MTEHGPVVNLQCLSMVGTSALLQSDWLKIVESMCPKLQVWSVFLSPNPVVHYFPLPKVVYFTRKLGDKALGWSDVVMMQSMREPRLLPCGHVGDGYSLSRMRTHECPICRSPFQVSTLVSLEDSITQLTRVESASWKATIVDVLRNPLDDKVRLLLLLDVSENSVFIAVLFYQVVYHSCGEFYNLSSLHKLYNVNHDLEIGGVLFQELAKMPCVKCRKLLVPLHVCFPRSAIEDDAQFASLDQASSYLISDI